MGKQREGAPTRPTLRQVTVHAKCHVICTRNRLQPFHSNSVTMTSTRAVPGYLFPPFDWYPVRSWHCSTILPYIGAVSLFLGPHSQGFPCYEYSFFVHPQFAMATCSYRVLACLKDAPSNVTNPLLTKLFDPISRNFMLSELSPPLALSYSW